MIKTTPPNLKNPYQLLTQVLKRILLTFPVAVTIGSVVAFFLWLLNIAIHFRFVHSWLLYLLPLAGLLIHFIYQSVGKSAERGNLLILEELHQKGSGIPKRMAPIILVTSVITHLFGGSAGREGTAVQIGGSIAAMFGRWFNLRQADTRILITAGIAAGFGAVFGTPLTGVVFALEVLAIGRVKYDAFLPALFAAFIGDLTVSAWHIHHTAYPIDQITGAGSLHPHFLSINLLLVGKVLIASVAFGLASLLFTRTVHEVKHLFLKVFKLTWMIPVIGGSLIILLTLLLGKPDYLSLGVDAEYPGAVTILSAFQKGGADTWSWLWKTLYTALTLSTGFKGGEVTPLFYIGATLGNSLSELLNAPVSLFAALGFIAIFAGATNTPLACTCMGVELFGGQHVLLFGIACFTAYFFSGHSSIYSSPKIASSGVDDSDISETLKSRGYIHEKLSKYRLFV
jgi:H+/Cl- antiporter ClcA